MGNHTKHQHGFTLTELVIGIALSVVLLSAMVPLLTTNIGAWIAGSSRSEVQQTARYAVDSMVRELRYSRNFQIETTFLNGQSITFVNLDTNNLNRYYLSNVNHLIYRQAITTGGYPQPLTGLNIRNSTNVVINPENQPLFEVPDQNTVLINLTATDTVTGQSVTIRTAVYSMSQYLK